jgi:hypothetical protein
MSMSAGAHPKQQHRQTQTSNINDNGDVDRRISQRLVPSMGTSHVRLRHFKSLSNEMTNESEQHLRYASGIRLNVVLKWCLSHCLPSK